MALVGTLENGRKVHLNPDYKTRKCEYRFIDASEMIVGSYGKRGNIEWSQVPIYSIFEDGELLVFVVIEGNTIVLSRL